MRACVRASERLRLCHHYRGCGVKGRREEGGSDKEQKSRYKGLHPASQSLVELGPNNKECSSSEGVRMAVMAVMGCLGGRYG